MPYIHLNPVRGRLVRRVDSPYARTSHRAYIGRDPVLPWLSFATILGACGEPARFHEHVQAYRRGTIEWPELLDIESGWFTPTGTKQTNTSRPALPSPASADQVMAQALRVVGGTEQTAMASVPGPRGNPKKRFLAWVLRRQAMLSNSEIAKRLDVSAPYVSKLLKTLPGSSKPPFKDWLSAWSEIYPEAEDG